MPSYASPSRAPSPTPAPAPAQAPQAAAEEPGSPAWLSSYNLQAGNAATLDALLGGGVSVDEGTATGLLSGATASRPAAPPPTPTHAPSGTMGAVYAANDRRTDAMSLQLTASQQNELAVFRANWDKNHARYETVAAQTGVPAKLIAAIHYRESSLNFGTYLHQGDPLGKKAVHYPSNIPVFYKWEDAAVHALNMKKGVKDAMGMDETTTDGAALATYAEAYNGLGYHNRGKASPYVFAGTDQYSGGRYVRDGVYDPRSWDQRLGVMALVDGLDGARTGPAVRSPQSGDQGWAVVLDGHELLRFGMDSDAVKVLQTKLTAAGFQVPATGHFGPLTRSAVQRFQKARGLDADGVVGAGTAHALDGTAAPGKQPEAPTNPEWARVLAGGHLVSRGEQGDHVKLVQTRLTARGFTVPATGFFGPQTQAAVRALQKANGLVVDGVVGQATARALEG